MKRYQERNIVSMLSRGNLPLQLGRYQTAEDIEEQRRQVLARDKKRQSIIRRIFNAIQSGLFVRSHRENPNVP